MTHLRDLLIRSPAFGSQGRILAPCPHLKPCPLGERPTSRTKRHQDWCWFRHRWDPPKQLAKLSSRVLDVLDYSYVLFQKGPTSQSPLRVAAEEKFHMEARVVSDVIPVNMNVKTKQFLETNLLPTENKPLIKGEKPFSVENVSGKVLLCTHKGVLEAGLVLRNKKEGITSRRGTALISLTTFSHRIRERGPGERNSDRP
jgi:ribosomal protein RSM22 (predicted rRNA methylase)